MNRILGIILIIVGGYLIDIGVTRKNSLVGQADTAATNVANSINGGTSEPRHVVYIAGGALLIFVGAAAIVRRGSAS
jgi:Protein of unknown function (DUF3185)